MYRIYPTPAAARENKGLVCPATLPKPGTKVQIDGVGTATVLESQPSLQSGLYSRSGSTSSLPPGFDCGCTLKVQYDKDGTLDTVSAAQKPPSVVDEWIEDNPLALLAAVVALRAMDTKTASGKYDEMRKRYEEALDAESPSDDLLPREALQEMSGEYWGGSEESDEGDQAIRVTLTFEGDGRITGRGRDGVDGSYRITGGRWRAGKDDGCVIEMHWEETYDEGFKVICTATRDAASGKVRAKFASSRDVSGVFTLAKIPSIF